MGLRSLVFSKNIVYIPIIATGGLFAVILFRTVFIVKPLPVTPCLPDDIDFIETDDNILGRFIDALKLQTISQSTDNINAPELVKFRQHLKRSFPTIHNSSVVFQEVINNYSLLYKIQGSDKSLQPYMLAAHLDVVPANKDTWTFPPFEGIIEDGYIYGRGTIDDKHSVMGIMEALEFSLKAGFQPKRTFYISFGHDEEVSGMNGAQKISEYLLQHGIRMKFVLDEGLFVTRGIMPGISGPLALVGVTEKGYLTVQLSAKGTAGHSSVPPRENTIAVLSEALVRLQNNPHPSRLGYGAETAMFEHIAPYASFPIRMIFANLWLFTPLLSMVFSKVAVQNALIRTTTAITMINGGVKENVLPASVSAIVNHRIHPSQTVEEVLDFDRRIINDERIHIQVKGAYEPHPVSNYSLDSFGYGVIHTSIRQIFPNAVVAPGVLVGNTDSRWYKAIADDVYRFTPGYLRQTDLARFHGDDERISIDNYKYVINFYYHLIQNADKTELPPLIHQTDEL